MLLQSILTHFSSIIQTLTMSNQSPTCSQTTFPLFGGPVPWSNASWTTVDDRVRDGSSVSSLSVNSSTNSAVFLGNLDTKTLGGAGFASQLASKATDSEGIKNETERIWDLAAYDGIEIEMGSGDAKTYTLILKDEVQGDRGDGRMVAGLSFEAKFVAPNTTSVISNRGGTDRKGKTVFLAWKDFKPFYRGKELEGKVLNKHKVVRVGLMMRSYFGNQEGGFKLEIRSIRALGEEVGDR